ncbi:hypothetical protein AUJ68_01480 [Candidatus Woesearchaeota archaeon CG1_02_57_44]|nr:MAG: hypothetical protein AUJ68_01480 [Candidatus Woesearchaeota archaeon CG1_02_57_44]
MLAEYDAPSRAWGANLMRRQDETQYWWDVREANKRKGPKATQQLASATRNLVDAIRKDLDDAAEVVRQADQHHRRLEKLRERCRATSSDLLSLRSGQLFRDMVEQAQKASHAAGKALSGSEDEMQEQQFYIQSRLRAIEAGIQEASQAAGEIASQVRSIEREFEQGCDKVAVDLAAELIAGVKAHLQTFASQRDEKSILSAFEGVRGVWAHTGPLVKAMQDAGPGLKEVDGMYRAVEHRMTRLIADVNHLRARLVGIRHLVRVLQKKSGVIGDRIKVLDASYEKMRQEADALGSALQELTGLDDDGSDRSGAAFDDARTRMWDARGAFTVFPHELEASANLLYGLDMRIQTRGGLTPMGSTFDRLADEVHGFAEQCSRLTADLCYGDSIGQINARSRGEPGGQGYQQACAAARQRVGQALSDADRLHKMVREALERDWLR